MSHKHQHHILNSVLLEITASINRVVYLYSILKTYLQTKKLIHNLYSNYLTA